MVLEVLVGLVVREGSVVLEALVGLVVREGSVVLEVLVALVVRVVSVVLEALVGAIARPTCRLGAATSGNTIPSIAVVLPIAIERPQTGSEVRRVETL